LIFKKTRRDYLQLLIEAQEVNEKKENFRSNEKATNFSELHIEKGMNEQVGEI
jgi:hypothetical protein